MKKLQHWRKDNHWKSKQKHILKPIPTGKGSPTAGRAAGRRARLGPRKARFHQRCESWSPAAPGRTSARTSWTSGPRRTTGPWGQLVPRTRRSPRGSRTPWPPTRQSPSPPEKCTLRSRRRRSRSRSSWKTPLASCPLELRPTAPARDLLLWS